MYELPDIPGCVLMQSKDQITAGNAARKDRMEGKAAISNTTTSCVFQLLQEAGLYCRGGINACMLHVLLLNAADSMLLLSLPEGSDMFCSDLIFSSPFVSDTTELDGWPSHLEHESIWHNLLTTW